MVVVNWEFCRRGVVRSRLVVVDDCMTSQVDMAGLAEGNRLSRIT